MQRYDFAADLLQTGPLSLDPLLAGNELAATACILGTERLLLRLDFLLFSRLVLPPMLPLSRQRRSILLQLARLRVQDRLGAAKQLLPFGKSALEFLFQAPPFISQLVL